MAVVAKVVRVSLLESQELDGAYIRLVTQSRVVGLTDTTPAVLNSALAAAGIPVHGTALTGFPELLLRQRNTKLVDGEPGMVDVDLVYEHLRSRGGGGQAINAPQLTGSLTVRASASVQQLRTNKDIFGETISTSHTWPAGDKNHPEGETEPQGGEVDFYSVMRSFTIQGTHTTQQPWLIANAIVGKINATAWSAGEVHTWMCVGVSWELLELAGASSTYRFEFELQHNPETWNPTVVFIDSATSKPPTGLIEGTGFKTVRIIPETDFEAVIGARIQGA